MDPIKHIVVLMMENHSFDQMLGFLGLTNPDVDGVNQSRFNIDPRDNSKVFQLPITTMVNQNDPLHEYTDALEHMKNNNGHFVSNYAGKYPTSTKNETQEVMGYYEDGAFPALHDLAKNFVVCDKWFSSLPGPTWPNRFFVHSGTSLGHVDMPSGLFDPGWHLYDQTTIYDLFEEANISWKIYFDGTPQSLLMTHQLAYGGHYHRFIEDFEKDCTKPESEFPSYVFIEPDYSGATQNDQHPPSNLMNGDRLIAKVYNAIRANDALWNSTLFVVIYDEDGGFYDHVTPPKTVAPDQNTDDFKFNILGFRIPAILVSPHLTKGTDHTIYDHTSILKYACQKWGLNPSRLGARVPYSNSIGHLFNTNAPTRFDVPAQVWVGQEFLHATRPMPADSHESSLIAFNHFMTDGRGISTEELLDVNASYDLAYEETLKLLKIVV